MTNIGLIPKVDEQHSMKDWRPISLCNVLYKLIIKVLANRVKKIMDKCTSNNQSAFFFQGDLFSTMLLAAIEVVRSLYEVKKREVELVRWPFNLISTNFIACD